MLNELFVVRHGRRMRTWVVCLLALVLLLSWTETTLANNQEGEDGGGGEKGGEDGPVSDGKAKEAPETATDESQAVPEPATGDGSGNDPNPEIPVFPSVLDFEGWYINEPSPVVSQTTGEEVTSEAGQEPPTSLLDQDPSVGLPGGQEVEVSQGNGEKGKASEKYQDGLEEGSGPGTVGKKGAGGNPGEPELKKASAPVPKGQHSGSADEFNTVANHQGNSSPVSFVSPQTANFQGGEDGSRFSNFFSRISGSGGSSGHQSISPVSSSQQTFAPSNSRSGSLTRGGGESGPIFSIPNRSRSVGRGHDTQGGRFRRSEINGLNR